MAANFAVTAKQLASAYQTESGHQVELSIGSTGKLYAQIVHGAPYDVFLAADTARPEKLQTQGLGVKGSQFTYALGRIALMGAGVERASSVNDVRRRLAALNAPEKLAIASATIAPYGKASIEAMQLLGLYDAVAPHLVMAENITQTYQFVATGNAALGFVAVAQVVERDTDDYWVVPQSLYAPIEQGAVLLERAAHKQAARNFITFLQNSNAQAIIEHFGYGLAAR